MDKSEQILELITKMNTEMKEEFKNVRNEMQEGFKDVNSMIDGLQIEIQEGLREAYNEGNKNGN